MKVVAYIPIKLHNERMPNKNIQSFDDGTLMAHLIFNTLSSVREIDEIYCYCSNPIIKNYFAGRVQFLQRDKSLDLPTVKRADIIHAFLNDVKDAEIILLSHVTSPFVKADSIRKCVNAVKSGEYDSAFSAGIVQEYLWQNNSPVNFNPRDAVRSQDLPLIYKETSGCFVFTRQLFQESGGYVGKKPFLCEVDKIEETDINYPQDFIIANAIYMSVIKNR